MEVNCTEPSPSVRVPWFWHKLYFTTLYGEGVGAYQHRDHSIHIERKTCTRPCYIGLRLAYGQKLECFKRTANDIYILTMNI
jgi:hypothetical protein